MRKLTGIVVLLIASSAAFAQLPTATILGVVKDSTGAVVPGANLTAKNIETGQARTATCGADGSYRFSALHEQAFVGRLAQPQVERHRPARQEIVEPSKRHKMRLLNDVGRIEPSSQAVIDPMIEKTAEGRPMPIEERVEAGGIAGLDAVQEPERLGRIAGARHSRSVTPMRHLPNCRGCDGKSEQKIAAGQWRINHGEDKLYFPVTPVFPMVIKFKMWVAGKRLAALD
jgi:hypothetical protein